MNAATSKLLERQTSGFSTEKDLMSFLQNRAQSAQARVYRKWFVLAYKKFSDNGDLSAEPASLRKWLGDDYDKGKATEELLAAWKDGTVFCRFGELFTRKANATWNKNPANEEECLATIQIGLSLLASDGIPVGGADPKTIYTGKVKEVLSVVYSIVAKHQLPVGQDTLLKWCSEKIVPLGVPVSDFVRSWLDGKALAALATAFKPGLFQPEDLTPSSKKFKIAELAQKTIDAGEELGIPPVLEVNDIGEHTPDRIVITYVSYYYDLFGPPAAHRALVAKSIALQRQVEEREKQLQQSTVELRYLVGSHKELRTMLEEQRTESQSASRQLMELSLRLPFYTQNFKSRVPPPDEGNIHVVLTSIHGSNVLWDTQPQAMEQALRLHNVLLMDAIASFDGYGVSMEGGNFTVVFSEARNAFRFCTTVQESLLAAEWPEDILKTDEAKKEEVDSKVVFNGLRVKMAVAAGELLCQQDSFGRTTYSGTEMSIASSLICVANPGQILVTEHALKLLHEDLNPEGPEFEIADSLAVELPGNEDLELSQATLNLKATGDIKVTDEETIKVLQALPSSLVAREKHFKEIGSTQLSDSAIDVRKVLIAKVEELEVKNKKLKDQLANMEQQAHTATMKADELLKWLSTTISAPKAEESLPMALESLKKLMEEHRELKDTLGALSKQNNSLSDYIKHLASELRESNFDQKLMTTKFNQLTKLHQNSIVTIQALKKERDALLKKLGKKGFLTKIKNKISGKKDDKPVAGVIVGENGEIIENNLGEDAEKKEESEDAEKTEKTEKTETKEGEEESKEHSETAHKAEKTEKPEEHAEAKEHTPKSAEPAAAPTASTSTPGETESKSASTDAPKKEKKLHRTPSGRSRHKIKKEGEAGATTEGKERKHKKKTGEHKGERKHKSSKSKKTEGGDEAAAATAPAPTTEPAPAPAQ